MLTLINICLGRNGRQARENGNNRNLGLGICMDTLCYHGTLGHVLWFRQPLTNYGYHTSPLLQDQRRCERFDLRFEVIETFVCTRFLESFIKDISFNCPYIAVRSILHITYILIGFRNSNQR